MGGRRKQGRKRKKKKERKRKEERENVCLRIECLAILKRLLYKTFVNNKE